MAPHLYQSSLVYRQADEKFMDVLKLLDFTGTRSMLEDEEMRALLMPTLRADFEAVVNYSRDFTMREPLGCPVTGFAAKRDLFAAPSSMVAWREYTAKDYRLSMLDVHHYFVETHKTYLARTIAAELAADLGRPDEEDLRRSVLELGHLAESAVLDAEPDGDECNVDASAWLSHHEAQYGTRVRLYCFPSALGATPGEQLARSAVADRAGITVIEAPAWEGPNPSIRAQANVLARAISKDAGAQSFAFFGHCSGAILMYEVTRRLQELGAAKPVHLFVSSAAAPHLYVMPNAFLLGDDKIVDVLDVIDHPLTGRLRQSARLRAQFLPTVRGDFEMMATYRSTVPTKLDVPITAIRAKNDLWTFYYGMEAWKEYTSASFELVTSEDGDHFHVEKDPTLAGDVISRTLGWGRSVTLYRGNDDANDAAMGDDIWDRAADSSVGE